MVRKDCQRLAGVDLVIREFKVTSAQNGDAIARNPGDRDLATDHPFADLLSVPRPYKSSRSIFFKRTEE